MPFDLKSSIIALIFLIPWHVINAMEQPPRKNSSSLERTSSGSFESSDDSTSRKSDSTPRLEPSKKSRNLGLSFRLRKSSSGSESSPLSPKLETPQHHIWFFGQDNIPLKCVAIGSVGSACDGKLLDILKSNFTQTFLATTSHDTNLLNQDCSFELPSLLRYSNITYIYPTESPKLGEIFQIIDECIGTDRNFAVYGISTTHRLFLTLVYWSIPKILEFALARDYLVQIHGQLFTFEQILSSSPLWHFATDYIMKIVLKRIIPDEVKRNQFSINEADSTKLNKYCIHCLKAYISKSDYPSPDLEEQ